GSGTSMNPIRAKGPRRDGRERDAARPRRGLRPTVVALEGRALLATFNVNSLLDAPGAVGTLRWAVDQANSHPGADTIDFDSTVFHTPRTITLTQGQLTLTDTSGATTIVGPGANLLTVSGNNASRVFQIGGGVPGATASIAGLTI